MTAAFGVGTMQITTDDGDVSVYSLSGSRVIPLRRTLHEQANVSGITAEMNTSTQYIVRVVLTDGAFVDLLMGEYDTPAGWTNDQAGQNACIEDIQAALVDVDTVIDEGP